MDDNFRILALTSALLDRIDFGAVTKRYDALHFPWARVNHAGEISIAGVGADQTV